MEEKLRILRCSREGEMICTLCLATAANHQTKDGLRCGLSDVDTRKEKQESWTFLTFFVPD